ncbi:MAG: hypothetical protein AAGE98_15060 [Actinomycetota bacterium]
MGAQSRTERIELLERSANALGAVAWTFAIVAVIAGSLAANDLDPASSGTTAAFFVSASGPYMIAAAGMMIARAVTLLALVNAEGD